MRDYLGATFRFCEQMSQVANTGGTRRESVCIRKIRLISLDTKDKRLSIVSRLNPSASSVKSTTTQVETTKASRDDTFILTNGIPLKKYSTFLRVVYVK